MIHNLKIKNKYLIPLLDGKKNFELRFNDRAYKVGDVLCFSGMYYFKIKYILKGFEGLKKGYVGLALTPYKRGRYITYRGRTQSLADWCREKGLNNSTVRSRLARGLKLDKVFAPKQKMYKDLTGRRFGKLTVIKPVGANKCGQKRWECLCDCGTVKVIITASLTTGMTRSCGCLRRNPQEAKKARNLEKLEQIGAQISQKIK